MATIKDLPEEIIRNIFYNVDFYHLFQNCSYVSIDWEKLITERYFPVEYFNSHFICHRKMTSNDLNLCVKLLFKSIKLNNVPLKAIKASSTDNIWEHQVFTISGIPTTYWSSIGSENEESVDTLEYGIFMNVGIIYEICLSFYEADWMEYTGRKHCFAAKNVQIEIRSDDLIYQSDIFIMEHNDRENILKFDKPILVTKNSRIIVHLIGKYEKHSIDSLYYVCVKNFSINGVSGRNIKYDYDKIEGFKEISIEEYNSLSNRQLYVCSRIKVISRYIGNSSNPLPEDTVNLLNYLYLLGIGELNPRYFCYKFMGI